MDSFMLRPIRGRIMTVFGRNPLVRTVDRLEALGMMIAAVVSICAIPVVAAMGTEVHESRSQFYADVARHRHTVLATTVEDSVTTVRANSLRFDVRAQWNDAGRSHVANVEAPTAMKRNETVEIWVDDGGDVAHEPPSSDQAGFEAVGTAVLAWFSLLATVVGVLAVVRQRANRARYETWDRELAELTRRDGRRPHGD